MLRVHLWKKISCRIRVNTGCCTRMMISGMFCLWLEQMDRLRENFFYLPLIVYIDKYNFLFLLKKIYIYIYAFIYFPVWSNDCTFLKKKYFVYLVLLKKMDFSEVIVCLSVCVLCCVRGRPLLITHSSDSTMNHWCAPIRWPNKNWKHFLPIVTFLSWRGDGMHWMEELLKGGKGQSVALLSKEISFTVWSNILCT